MDHLGSRLGEADVARGARRYWYREGHVAWIAERAGEREERRPPGPRRSPGRAVGGRFNEELARKIRGIAADQHLDAVHRSFLPQIDRQPVPPPLLAAGVPAGIQIAVHDGRPQMR